MVKSFRALTVVFLVSAALVACAPVATFAETPEERRARLSAELASIEAEIAANRSTLAETQKERTSLERDIAILDNQIETAQLSIKQRDIALSGINSDIGQKQVAIRGVDDKAARSEAALAHLIRRTREVDDLSLVELVLSNSLSGFFDDVDAYANLQNQLDDSFDEMLAIRSDLASRKEALETRQAEEEELRRLQVLEKQAIEKKEREKQQILDVTKGQEEAYQGIIAEKQRTAAQIRSALFGLRDTGAIPFGQAYEFAQEASAQTGVRPALILAILRQETNLGENVGQCLLTNTPNKGDGKGKNTGRHFDGVMKAGGSRDDVAAFMQITAELGIDPFSQVVSCPPSYGYGGAMGPAQFIPSTWMLFKDRIAEKTGQNPPNPWSPRTAIFATALLMYDNGADTGTRSAERLAALRYFAGWGNAHKAAYAFYGDSVMEFADQYQSDIDILEGR
jgi:membrane-bound lytic murein transglycosylase B